MTTCVYVRVSSCATFAQRGQVRGTHLLQFLFQLLVGGEKARHLRLRGKKERWSGTLLIA